MLPGGQLESPGETDPQSTTGSEPDAPTVDPVTPEAPSKPEVLETARNIWELLFNSFMKEAIRARHQRYASMTPAEQAKYLERVGGIENLDSQRINFLICGWDIGDFRVGIADDLWKDENGNPLLRTKEGALTDIALAVSIDPATKKITIAYLDRELRVPETGGRTLASASFVDHNHPRNPDGTWNYYPPEKMREIAEDATGETFDGVFKFTFDGFVDFFDTLFPQGLVINLPIERAFASNVTWRQAFSKDYLETKMNDPDFILAILKKASADQMQEKKNLFERHPGFAEQNLEQDLARLLSQDPSRPLTADEAAFIKDVQETCRNFKVNYPDGAMTLDGEMALFAVRARQQTTPALADSHAAQSSTSRGDFATFLFGQAVNDSARTFKDRTTNGLDLSEAAKHPWELFPYLTDIQGQLQFQEGINGLLLPLIQAAGRLEPSNDLAIHWDLTSESFAQSETPETDMLNGSHLVVAQPEKLAEINAVPLSLEAFFRLYYQSLTKLADQLSGDSASPEAFGQFLNILSAGWDPTINRVWVPKPETSAEGKPVLSSTVSYTDTKTAVDYWGSSREAFKKALSSEN